jgi:hypothetical protein
MGSETMVHPPRGEKHMTNFCQACGGAISLHFYASWMQMCKSTTNKN